MNHPPKNVKQLIANGDTKIAIDTLLEHTFDTKFYNEIIQQSAKLKAYEKAKRVGNASRRELDLELTQINEALLQITDEISYLITAKELTYSLDTSEDQTQLVEIILEGNILDFNSTRKENLISITAAILDIHKSSIRIKKIISGSVIVYMELPSDKAVKLVSLVRDQNNEIVARYKSFNIISIQVIDSETKEGITPNVQKKSKRSFWSYITAAAVFIGMLGSAAEFLNFINFFPNNPSSNSGNTVTVLVHGPRGKDDLVLPNRGIVYLIYGDAKVPEQINNEGEATFKQVSKEFFNKNTQVEILFQDPQGGPYRTSHPDSLYSLTKGQYVSLQVESVEVDQVTGIIKDSKTENPIANVEIRIHAGLSTKTNEYGEFTLGIPEQERRPFVNIRVYKKGYESNEVVDYSKSNEVDLVILMNRQNVGNPPQATDNELQSNSTQSTEINNEVTTSGYVQDEEGNKLIGVLIQSSKFEEIYSDTTKNNGSFSIRFPQRLEASRVEFILFDKNGKTLKYLSSPSILVGSKGVIFTISK